MNSFTTVKFFKFSVYKFANFGYLLDLDPI